MIRNISLYIKDILQNMRDAEDFISRSFTSISVWTRRQFGSLSRIVSLL